jgi:hypothetical protein
MRGRLAALARAPRPAYFSAMAPFSRHDSLIASSPRTGPALRWGGAGLGALALLAAAMLWVRYGTAVFFDMIASGFAACF